MIQPPMMAPTMPTTMSPSAPKPWPCMIFPVAQPALSPTMIHQMMIMKSACEDPLRVIIHHFRLIPHHCKECGLQHLLARVGEQIADALPHLRIAERT